MDVLSACKGKRCSNIRMPPTPDSCGEDSFFISQKTQMVGITDGVGGWNDQNVDPSQISRRMMYHASCIAESDDKLTPFQVLKRAYEKTLQDPSVEAGSCTACLLKVRDNMLEYSNLGDSGFVIIRERKIHFQSSFQSIGLAPFQLAKIPPYLKGQGAIETPPEDADSGQIPLREGDIIVLATDGVWDNFSPDLQAHMAYHPPFQRWYRFWRGPVDSLINVLEQDGDAAANVLQAALRHNLKPDDVTVLVIKIGKQT